jgi:hypothetical protein
MSLYCPAVDVLDDLPPDSRREVVAAVGAALGVNPDEAEEAHSHAAVRARSGR